MTSQSSTSDPQYADRCYRSPSALAGGFVLLALALWLTIDAVINGSGRTPWAATSGLLCFVPLVVAFTLRPAVFAGRERLRVRNPFRTITISWRSVEAVKAGYSSEVVADGTTYQLWAIPVSFRARKSANHHNARLAAGQPPGRGLLGRSRATVPREEMTEKRAPSDSAIEELRELALAHGDEGETPAPEAPVSVRWSYETLAPTLFGAVALALVFTA